MITAKTTAKQFTHHLQSIDTLIKKGDLPGATEKLNEAVHAFPGDPRVYLMGSRMAEAAGNAAGARELVEKAVSLAPQWTVAVTEYAHLLARQNQFSEAITQAERAVLLDPRSPDVLQRVIEVAHRAQSMSHAVQWLQLAMQIAPTMPIKRLLAADLRALNRHDEALAIYTQMLEALPGDLLARLGRLQTAYDKGDMALALSDSQFLLADDPSNAIYLFWQTLANGGTPATQPVSVFKEIFDSSADLYDQHMVRSLRYQLPKQIAQRIIERYPDLKLNLLDLGCGTGLLGVCLGRINGALVGVDVSTPMIEQAARHQLYDRFHTVNLLDALAETPDSLYQVIAACDVFIYVGELRQAIANAHRILVAGGHLMFSCETALETEADLVLRPSMRYAHKRSHIQALCQAAGLVDVSIEDTDLRLENNQAVKGFVVVARKP
jgi:predicted TPR repeat methyltransferase